MNVLRTIRRILKQNEDIEIWLSQMAMNSLFCDADIVRVAEKYLVIKILSVELVVEPGLEEEIEGEISNFRLETVQDLYQRKKVVDLKELI